MESEAQILSDILVTCSERYECSIIDRRNIGVAKDKFGRTIRFGKQGQADIWLYLCTPSRQFAIPIEIEVKNEKGKMSQEQVNWQRVCKRGKVVHILARSVEDVTSVCDALMGGESP